jgi:hypothetical protein
MRATRVFVLCAALLLSASALSQSGDGCHTGNAAAAATGAVGKNGTSEPAAVLPGAPSQEVYKPLTARQKFGIFAHRTYSPYTFYAAAFNAAWEQAMGDFPTYGGGMQGWGKRFGASLADTEVRTFFGSFAFPVVFHQDPRFFRSRKRGVIPRVWYAGTRVLIARSDSGKSMFNYSEVLGALATSSMQNAYYPDRDRGFSDTMGRYLGTFTSDATSDIIKEFTPDIVRFVQHHAPARMKRLHNRIAKRVPLDKIEGIVE